MLTVNDILTKPINRLLAGFVVSFRDSRPQRVIELLAMVFLLSGIDLAITLGQITSVGMFEDNPIALIVIRATGTVASLIALKTLTLGVSVGIMSALRHRWQAEVGAWVALGVLIWLTVRWSLYLQVMAGLDAQSVYGLVQQVEWLMMN